MYCRAFLVSVLNYCRRFAHLVEMSKKRKHSSCSLKYKLESPKPIEKGDFVKKKKKKKKDYL
jgi:hypothetical protein